ncbi:auxin-responsive protein SAUR32-like [Olea europaea var. sylvestris]|uniref:Auxin-responsive SAUR32-like n=1 Tax=Olea europaea subsp. europaea TaxID=158383 RepID=A0A8S0UPE0_OLEEU|nr:auxin-responsive protein SAUR32-like [Olea europaea var. sylvestris]CAA3022052.1 auxin-responsive SAUR32-like [Olea europaea subsp. europaea]
MVSEILLIFLKIGGREKSLPPFLRRHHHHHGKRQQQQVKDVPKGCLAVKVGQGENQQRFVIPVIYFNHPLFIQLLKEAEEEYGFDQKGTITIPCHVEEFRNIQGMIDRENHHSHHHQVSRFRA